MNKYTNTFVTQRKFFELTGRVGIIVKIAAPARKHVNLKYFKIHIDFFKLDTECL